jgi:enoyl-CoA hydratase
MTNIGEEVSTLRFERPDRHIGVLVLNRPEVANAINTRMARELLQFFEGIAQQAGELRCVIMTGEGGKAFCSGGDLKERAGMSVTEWSAQHAIVERVILMMLECPIPLIAAVNGAAYGGGCELAAACDFIYAARGARFALTETRLGIIPGAGGTQTLPRAVGTRRSSARRRRSAPTKRWRGAWSTASSFPTSCSRKLWRAREESRHARRSR